MKGISDNMILEDMTIYHLDWTTERGNKVVTGEVKLVQSTNHAKAFGATIGDSYLQDMSGNGMAEVDHVITGGGMEPTELVANKTKMGGHVSRKNEEIQGALLFLGILVTKSFVMRPGLSDLGNTRMTIQLADKSIKYPIGIAEDVQMQADYFPC
ncbi:hypothetical protein OSB04_024648 [Centaurea solstitialis]|uniref:Uncharacterized protein n=1 Tax=Centaurea solstitialis TaxID=347529 RepID=A0AA38WE20_9ASTR|nr:hypothetical protein OSB04_024648 [Centaurea solstitialis]